MKINQSALGHWDKGFLFSRYVKHIVKVSKNDTFFLIYKFYHTISFRNFDLLKFAKVVQHKNMNLLQSVSTSFKII